MNNLQIFKNSELAKLKIDKQLSALGSLAYLLGEASDAKTDEKAWEYMRAASAIGHLLDCDTFNHLYGAVACQITRKFLKDEFYYQGLFKKYACQIIPGCELAKVKTDNKNIPDAWIKLCGDLIPVEVKLGEFNNAALAQLTRYMKAYNARTGIAVGKKLTVQLPKSILFISLYQLEELEDASHSI